MNYEDIFSPQTLSKLNKKSAENLKQMIGDKNLMQTMMSSQKLLGEISKAEAPYKQQLEELAVQMVEDLYPIINEEGIKIDAKIVGIGDVNSTLDEIKINNPGFPIKINNFDEYKNKLEQLNKKGFRWYNLPKQSIKVERDYINDDTFPIYIISRGDYKSKLIDIKKFSKNLDESISPESRRRIINGITQGAALRGAFSFYMFKEYLDAMDDTLVDKYNQIMKNSFGIYDDDNAIAMLLSLLAQGHKAAGGSSKVIINEIKVNSPTNLKTPIKITSQEEWDKIYPTLNRKNYKNFNLGSSNKFGNNFESEDWDKIRGANDSFYLIDKLGVVWDNEVAERYGGTLLEQQESGITIRARAICFPMLVHEIIKGLYELVSLQGFKGDKEANQGVVDKVDKLENEPHDLKYGKYIYDALNDIFAESQYSDSRIREFFFQEVYQLEDEEFLTLIENAINEELTPQQKRWVDQTLKEISMDLKADDASQYID